MLELMLVRSLHTSCPARSNGAVQLIEGAQGPPPGPNGEGTHVNTYANPC